MDVMAAVIIAKLTKGRAAPINARGDAVRRALKKSTVARENRSDLKNENKAS